MGLLGVGGSLMLGRERFSLPYIYIYICIIFYLLVLNLYLSNLVILMEMGMCMVNYLMWNRNPRSRVPNARKW